MKLDLSKVYYHYQNTHILKEEVVEIMFVNLSSVLMAGIDLFIARIGG